MSGRTSARNGKVYIDISSAANGSATPVSFLKSWSIDQTTDSLEVTSFGDTTKTYVAGGLPDASGSMDGFANLGTQTFTYLADGNARKIYLYPDASGNSGTYFFGTAFFGASYEGAVDGAIAVTMNWNAATSISWVAGL